MNKILFIFACVVLLVGTIGALSFGLNKSDFTNKVLTLDPNVLCEKGKDLISNENLLYCKDNMRLINVEDSSLLITKNRDGVIKVESK